MSILTNFLERGTLPFIGRERERERLLGFWRNIPDAEGLRVALLLGEAGVGKSRLTELIARDIEAMDGIVVHVKLYPESSTSLLPLLLAAVRSIPIARKFLHPDADETHADVTNVFRRICRLRPTLVIVEDVHLLQDVALSEFERLLRSLTDELISVMCVARPVHLPVRRSIESYLSEEILLRGLEQEELEELWKELFGSEGRGQALAALNQATAGNPLAVRSALRAVVSKGLIAGLGSGDRWEVVTQPTVFRNALQQNADLHSEGMVAHLTEDERHRASTLSTLGEVFSREAAMHLIGGSGEELDTLLRNGLIAITHYIPSSLTHQTSEFPLLAFTHSLLHRFLYERSELDPSLVLDVVAKRLPLYSIAPYEMLRSSADNLPVDSETLVPAIRSVFSSTFRLLFTADWRYGVMLNDCADVLIGRCKQSSSDEEFNALRLDSMNIRLNFAVRAPEEMHYRALLSRFMHETEHPDTPRLARFRLLALAQHCNAMGQSGDVSVLDGVLSEFDVIAERFPEVRQSFELLSFLNVVSANAAEYVDEQSAYRIYEHFRSLLALPEISDEFKCELEWRMYPPLLRLFDTQAEVEERMEWVRVLDTAENPYRENLDVDLLQVCIARGQFREALSIYERYLPRTLSGGLMRVYAEERVMQLLILHVLNMDFEHVLAGLEAFGDTLPEWIGTELVGIIRRDMRPMALLCDRRDLAEAVDNRSDATGQHFRALLEEDLLMKLRSDCTREQLAEVFDRTQRGTRKGVALHALLGKVLQTPLPEAELIADARELLSSDIIRIRHLLVVCAVIDLLHWSADNGAGAILKSVHGDIAGAVKNMLQWLAEPERRLPAFMLPIVNRYESYLDGKSVKEWRKRIEVFEKQRREELEAQEHAAGAESSVGIRVMMLGSVSVQHPDNEVEKIRGARACALIGAMVANEMLAKPLDRIEFNRLVTGENDPEMARNNLKPILHRVRESLGADNVPFEGDTPRLYRSKITVDILEAHRHLKEVESALPRLAFLKAVPELNTALDIVGNDVAFPSLYDAFFEAMREDFENRIREATVRVAEELMRAGDGATAEELLRKGLRTVPEDEQMMELLREGLLMQGKRAEAERVRLGAE